ncbi:MAG: dephospho-CoA kinase [Bacteroidaceae bacterium]
MRKYGITGGIGSGKSYVCKLLQDRGIPVFNCDEEARSEMLVNAEIHQELETLIGVKVITPQGALAKNVIAAYICSDKRHADKVNQIVHPRVRQRLARWIKEQKNEIVVVECALLFESNLNADVDRTILVLSPLEMRIERVMKRDHTTRQKVEDWMSLQNSETENRKRADYLLFNDEEHSLCQQLDNLFVI